MLYKRTPSQKIGGKAREFGSMLCAWFEVLEMFLSHWLRSPSQWWYMGFPGPRNTRPNSLPSYPCSAKWARKLGKMSALHRCPDVLLTSWLIAGLDYVRLPFQTCDNLYLIGINMIMNGIKTEPPIFSQKDSIASIMSGIGMYPTNIRIYSPKK